MMTLNLRRILTIWHIILNKLSVRPGGNLKMPDITDDIHSSFDNEKFPSVSVRVSNEHLSYFVVDLTEHKDSFEDDIDLNVILSCFNHILRNTFSTSIGKLLSITITKNIAHDGINVMTVNNKPSISHCFYDIRVARLEGSA